MVYCAYSLESPQSTSSAGASYNLDIVGQEPIVVRRCWVNFHCRGVLQTWLTVGQGPIGLSVGAGGGCLDIFTLLYLFSSLSPSLWETARYRLKYCLKGPLNPKQPTNQPKGVRAFEVRPIWNHDISVAFMG